MLCYTDLLDERWLFPLVYQIEIQLVDIIQRRCRCIFQRLVGGDKLGRINLKFCVELFINVGGLIDVAKIIKSCLAHNLKHGEAFLIPHRPPGQCLIIVRFKQIFL